MHGRRRSHSCSRTAAAEPRRSMSGHVTALRAQLASVVQELSQLDAAKRQEKARREQLRRERDQLAAEALPVERQIDQHRVGVEEERARLAELAALRKAAEVPLQVHFSPGRACDASRTTAGPGCATVALCLHLTRRHTELALLGHAGQEVKGGRHASRDRVAAGPVGRAGLCRRQRSASRAGAPSERVRRAHAALQGGAPGVASRQAGGAATGARGRRQQRRTARRGGRTGRCGRVEGSKVLGSGVACANPDPIPASAGCTPVAELRAAEAAAQAALQAAASAAAAAQAAQAAAAAEEAEGRQLAADVAALEEAVAQTHAATRAAQQDAQNKVRAGGVPRRAGALHSTRLQPRRAALLALFDSLTPPRRPPSLPASSVAWRSWRLRGNSCPLPQPRWLSSVPAVAPSPHAPPPHPQRSPHQRPLARSCGRSPRLRRTRSKSRAMTTHPPSSAVYLHPTRRHPPQRSSPPGARTRRLRGEALAQQL